MAKSLVEFTVGCGVDRRYKLRCSRTDEYGRYVKYSAGPLLPSLEGVPGYEGSRQHYADAPYNTRPLLFGFDPELLERDGVRFIKPAKRIADERELTEEEVTAQQPATTKQTPAVQPPGDESPKEDAAEAPRAVAR